MKKKLTVPEVAKMKNVTPSCVYNWIKLENGLPYVEEHGRILVNESDAKKFKPPPMGRKAGSKNKATT